MESSGLQKQLQKDAEQDVPPFAADSIKLARQMGTAASDVLLEEIKAGGETRFLALEALREAAPDLYNLLPPRTRADIYGEALRTGNFYNTWGVPGYQLTDTARAFIDLGPEAVAILEKLLDETRTAPLSGSQSASTSKVYGNRICDYALVFINEINKRPYTYSQDPVERDQAIKELRESQ